MTMMLVFTANDRILYMKQVMESWSKVRGIKDVDVLFRVEPTRPEMVDLCATGAFGRSVKVIRNAKHHGALHNPWLALEDGFAREDFVIIGEDDSTVSDDILEFFSHCEQAFRQDDNVLAVCSFQDKPAGDLHEVIKKSWFSPTVWGTWRDRWEGSLRDSWDHNYSQRGWDWNIQENVLAGRTCVFPALSRSQHIGKFHGTHMQAHDFDRLQSKCFSPTYEAGTFQEVVS